MLQLQSSVMPRFKRNTMHLPNADNTFTGNTFDILQPWLETNWNTSTCHCIDLWILVVPKAVLWWLYVKTTREITLPWGGQGQIRVQEQGGSWEGRHIVLPWVAAGRSLSLALPSSPGRIFPITSSPTHLHSLPLTSVHSRSQCILLLSQLPLFSSLTLCI